MSTKEDREKPKGHSRLKGAGMGYLKDVAPVSFRLTAAQRERFNSEADALGLTYADFGRTLVVNALDCDHCNPHKKKQAA